MLGGQLAHQRRDVGAAVGPRRQAPVLWRAAARRRRPGLAAWCDRRLRRGGCGLRGRTCLPAGRVLVPVPGASCGGCCLLPAAPAGVRSSGLAAPAEVRLLPAAGPTAAGAAADHGELGTHGHGLVLGDEDLGQHAGGGRGDLGVDLVGGDLEQRLVGVDLVALLLEPAGDGALGDALTERRHRHRCAVPVAAAVGLRRLLLRLFLWGGDLLRLLLLRLFLWGGDLLRLLRVAVPWGGGGSCCGCSCWGGLLLLLGRCFLLLRGFLLGRFLLWLFLRGRCLLGAALVTASRAVTDDGELRADLDRLVLTDDDLLQHAGGGRGDLGVDLVRRDLEQRLVGVDLVALLLEPAGDGAFGDALTESRHGYRGRHGCLDLLRVSGPTRRPAAG